VAHPLDRPVWNTLTSGLAHLASGDATALKIDPDHGLFAASADLSINGLAALRTLAGSGEIWIVERMPLPAVTGLLVP
jgi:hypothetical protein